MTLPTPTGYMKIDPGRYVCWRRVVIGGTHHERRLVVINPAYGSAVLKDWEDQVRSEARAQEEASRQ